jgi:hypothetical protein
MPVICRYPSEAYSAIDEFALAERRRDIFYNGRFDTKDKRPEVSISEVPRRDQH